MKKECDVLVFFGAGATALLNAPVTDKQENFFRCLCGEGPIKERLEEFVKENFKNKKIKKDFLEDIERTLTILYDGNGVERECEARENKISQLENYFGLFEKEFQLQRKRKASLEHFYYVYVLPYFDWLAFKSIVQDLSKFSDRFSIQDVLSILTKGSLEGISIPTSEVFREEKKRTLGIYVNYPQRLSGALNVYKLLVFKLFKHLLRDFAESYSVENVIRKYREFSENLVKYGIENVNDIQSILKFATLNWDPLFPFFLLRSVRDINQNCEYWQKKRFYLNYGSPFKVVKLSTEEKSLRSLYIIDEDAAFYSKLLSEEYKLCNLETYILKFYSPHGLMNMRVCPRCKNIFLIFPNDVGKLGFKEFLDIFLLDPIPSRLDMKRMKKYKLFDLSDLNPSQINCPYCGTPTYFMDTFLQIQSILKPKDPPAIEKSYFDYAVSFADSGHLLFIGYSFPIDDIPHLLTLLTLGVNASNSGEIERKFSLVLYNPKIKVKKWMSYKEACKYLTNIGEEGRRDLGTLENVLKLARKDSIRVSFSGFPGILKEIGFKDIIKWSFPM